MHSSTFTFARRQYDDQFHTLDRRIAEIARSVRGCLGEEAWENPGAGLMSSVYDGDTIEALRQLIGHPDHVQAREPAGSKP